MNRQQWILCALALVLIGGATALLAKVKNGQRLGAPGVRTSALPGTDRLQVELPEKVPGYTSEWVEVDDLTLATLPKDTSYGQRRYQAADGFVTMANVVLMGGDRSSLHKPQFCLTGQGWKIDNDESAATTIKITRPHPYDLPVVKLLASKEIQAQGQTVRARGIYVYWYVADNALSASTSGLQRMWWMARDLVRTGVLQRWAYVSFFAVCPPGQEDATFQRMAGLIAEACPEFQLASGAAR